MPTTEQMRGWLASQSRDPALGSFSDASRLAAIAAQTELAWRFAQGKGCKADQAKATEWFEKSAGQGYPEAMFVLGWRKINGEGTSVDEAKGIELYMKAAARGVAQAQYNMALRFEEGRGVPKDDDKALKYYTQVGPHPNLRP